jgi:hypothetical protein
MMQPFKTDSGVHIERAPNGLPFSCRKRAATACQNTNDLVRAAVGWNGGLGGLVTDARLLPA